MRKRVLQGQAMKGMSSGGTVTKGSTWCAGS
jgi:hypothetical protein